MIQEKLEEKRRWDRSPTRWTDAVRQFLNTNMEGTVRIPEDSDAWRVTIRNAIKVLEGQET